MSGAMLRGSCSGGCGYSEVKIDRPVKAIRYLYLNLSLIKPKSFINYPSLNKCKAYLAVCGSKGHALGGVPWLHKRQRLDKQMQINQYSWAVLTRIEAARE